MPELLGFDELAELLHRSRSTIKKESSQAPWKLPPRIKLPGSRKPLWLKADVIKWLEQHREK